MSEQNDTADPIKLPERPPIINGISPDDLMDDFRGKPLFQVLAMVLVLHVLVIGAFSYGYFKKQIVGDDTIELSDEERMNLAAREATAAVREIAEKHGVNKQQLANRFGEGELGAVASDSGPNESARQQDAAQPDPDSATPQAEPSDIERAITEQADGPTLPELDDDISQEDPIFPE